MKRKFVLKIKAGGGSLFQKCRRWAQDVKRQNDGGSDGSEDITSTNCESEGDSEEPEVDETYKPGEESVHEGTGTGTVEDVEDQRRSSESALDADDNVVLDEAEGPARMKRTRISAEAGGIVLRIVRPVNYSEEVDRVESNRKSPKKISVVKPIEQQPLTMSERILTQSRDQERMMGVKRGNKWRKFQPQFAFLRKRGKEACQIRMYPVEGVCGVSRMYILDGAGMPHFVRVAWIRIPNEEDKSLADVHEIVGEILNKSKDRQDGNVYTEAISEQGKNEEAADDGMGCPLAQVKVGQDSFTADGRLKEGATGTCVYSPVPVCFDSLNFDALRLVQRYVEKNGVSLLDAEFNASLNTPGVHTVTSPVGDISSHLLNFYSPAKIQGIKCNDVGLWGHESVQLMMLRLRMDRVLDGKDVPLIEVDFRERGPYKIPFEYRYRPETGFVEQDGKLYYEGEAGLETRMDETRKVDFKRMAYQSVCEVHSSKVLPMTKRMQRMDGEGPTQISLRNDIYEQPDNDDEQEEGLAEIVDVVPIGTSEGGELPEVAGSSLQGTEISGDRYHEMMDMASGKRLFYVDRQRNARYLLTTEKDLAEITTFIEDRKKYKCPYDCNYIAFTRNAIDCHQTREHKDERVKCPLCPTERLFYYGDSLEKHQKRHFPIGERNKYCETCRMYFQSLAKGHKCLAVG